VAIISLQTTHHCLTKLKNKARWGNRDGQLASRVGRFPFPNTILRHVLTSNCRQSHDGSQCSSSSSSSSSSRISTKLKLLLRSPPKVLSPVPCVASSAQRRAVARGGHETLRESPFLSNVHFSLHTASLSVDSLAALTTTPSPSAETQI
jgi:hypothetical protein